MIHAHKNHALYNKGKWSEVKWLSWMKKIVCKLYKHYVTNQYHSLPSVFTIRKQVQIS